MHKQMYSLPPEWETAISDWIEWKAAGGSPATSMRTRRGHLRRTARTLRCQSPGEVTQKMLVKMAAAQTWSNDHRRGMRASLVQFFAWATSTGLVETNPAQSLPIVPEPHPRPRQVTDGMWADALAKADPRQRIAARLAEEVGMRREEVARTHTSDINRAPDGFEIIVHGKGNKDRVVPITTELAAELLKGPGGHTPGRGTAGYLFPGSVNGHISADYVGKLVADLLPAGWSMHKLRHRFAARMHHASGGNILIVKELLGHSSVATTQRYLSVSRQELRRAVDNAAHISTAATSIHHT